MDPKQRIETRCVQAGWQPKNGDPRVLPIFQSTTFKYDSAEVLGKLFDLEVPGHFYTRLSNPTLECVENKIAALEGGVGALVTSSGQAASLFAILNLCQAGDHVVSTVAIYGGTFNLFSVTMKRMGIAFTFVNQNDAPEKIAAAFRPNTKAFFAETVTNPSLEIADLEKLARIAHAHGVPLIVDNTFPTPINCRPIEWGADIVTHSTTKYLDGHATSVGGAIVEKGDFDWSNGKFPEFVNPDKSYHGIIYPKQFPTMPYSVKMRAQWIRDMGNPMMPFNAFLTMLGIETLHVRMDRHCSNALAMAKFLESHPKVAWVNYPGLPSSKEYALAQKYMPKGASGVLTFGIKGGKAAGEKVMDHLKLAAIVVHVADVRTCVLHPASMTHRQLSESELIAAGVSPDLIRLSVGIENIEDIKADFDQALSFA